MMNKRVLAVVGVLSGILVLCLVLSVAPVQARKFRVVTTFSILEDLVRQVGGEKVQVNSLVPLGADPHSWEATPKESRLVAEADLLVANGGGFDQWLINLQKNAARPGTPLVFVSQGLAALTMSSSGHDHHGGDPHFWLSVPNTIHYVDKITEALVALSPENTEYFLERSQLYLQELEELDRKIMLELGQIPVENRVIVTYHNAFSYLAERYGFAVVDFLVENPEAEPSPRDLGRLVQLLKQQVNPVVFAEPQLNVSTRYVETLAKEIQGKIYILYSDSLSEDVPSYVEMMNYNVKTLLEALK